MKSIDFTHTGGFPLTQDELNYLQEAYTECINAITATGAIGSTPVIISGMTMSIPGAGEVSLSDGWLFYNGELVKFTGSTQTVGIGGSVAVIEIVAGSTNLTYNDGSVFPAVKDKTGSLISALSITDATHFPFSSMKTFQQVFGENSREMSWNSITVSTDPSVGGVTGTIDYKKNSLTNTLQVKGSLSAANAQNFSASPYTAFYSMCTLPAEYYPANSVNFLAQYFLSAMIKDDLGVAWIKDISATINATGVLSLNWLKPDSSVSGYSVSFNVILPLD